MGESVGLFVSNVWVFSVSDAVLGQSGASAGPSWGQGSGNARRPAKEAAAKRGRSAGVPSLFFFSSLHPCAPSLSSEPPWTTQRWVLCASGLRVWGWAGRTETRAGRSAETLPPSPTRRGQAILLSAFSCPFSCPPRCRPTDCTLCRHPVGMAVSLPPVFFARHDPNTHSRVFLFADLPPLPSPPSTPQVERQIDQMVRFIRQEAEEKAAEIGVSAEEVRYGQRGGSWFPLSHTPPVAHPHSLSLPSYHTQPTSHRSSTSRN